jgi:uncharacterized protein YtpQ (UPF0354 family)
VIPDWARRAFSGKTDDALRKLVDREDARREVENTRWYRALTERLEEELKWTEQELRSVSVFHFQKLQAYASSLEIVIGFVKASKNSGNIAGELLSERIEKNRSKSVDEHMEMIFGRSE